MRSISHRIAAKFKRLANVAAVSRHGRGFQATVAALRVARGFVFLKQYVLSGQMHEKRIKHAVDSFRSDFFARTTKK